MDNKKYNVTLLHTPASDSITNKLATLFKIPADKAQLILQKESFVIKKQTDLATAEKFHKAITRIGANCRIDEPLKDELIKDTPLKNQPTKEENNDLPAIEEVVNQAKVKPLTDITQPDIAPQHEDEIELSLADGSADSPATLKQKADQANTPAENSSTDHNEKVFDDIKPDDLCPACGTIRASADSNCVQCGYDPKLSQKSPLKTRLFLAAIVIAIIVIAAVIGLPYFQQYQKQLQIEDDLGLAFETRNKITAFIQKTNFWPNQNIDANLNKVISNTSIKSIIISENATMTVTIRAQALNGEEQTLIFTPNTLKGRIVWNCLKGNLSESYRPNICRVRPLIE